MNLRKSARKQHQAGPFVALRLELALFLRRYRTRTIDNGIALNADITLRQIILGQAPSRRLRLLTIYAAGLYSCALLRA